MTAILATERIWRNAFAGHTMVVGVLAMLVLSLGTWSFAQTSYALQRDVVRTFGPVDHAENPKDARGIVWTAPNFDDRRWSAGSLTEKNSIPPRKSRLYRHKIAISEPPPASVRVMLRATADDGMAVWLGGFQMGQWGSGKNSQLSGSRTIDLTDKLTPGVHVLAIRVDNGTGDSSLEANLVVVDVETPAFLKADDWFWKNLSSPREDERQDALSKARQMVERYPNDLAALEFGFFSYYFVEPRDVEAARSIMESAIKQRMVFSPGNFCNFLTDLGEHQRALSLAREADWSRTSAGTKEFHEGTALLSMGENEQARTSLMNTRFPPGSHSERLDACLDAGLLSSSLPIIKREAATCERDGKNAGGVGGLLIRIGDYTRAQRIYARWYQADRNGAVEPMADLAFRMGDFPEAERLYRERLNSVTVTPTRGHRTRRWLQGRLLLTLAEQGRTEDAKKLISEMDLGIYPSQPAYSQEAIWHSFLPRLQAAMVLGDQKHIDTEAQRLLSAVRERHTRCSCNDVRPEVLLALAQALRQTGKDEDVREVCGYVVQGAVGALDVALPQNQAALGRANVLLGNREAALKHLGDAALLAPDDYWIKKELAALKSAK